MNSSVYVIVDIRFPGPVCYRIQHQGLCAVLNSLPQTTMVDRHKLPEGSRPNQAIRNNGPDDLALERFKLRELAEG